MQVLNPNLDPQSQNMPFPDHWYRCSSLILQISGCQLQLCQNPLESFKTYWLLSLTPGDPDLINLGCLLDVGISRNFPMMLMYSGVWEPLAYGDQFNPCLIHPPPPNSSAFVRFLPWACLGQGWGYGVLALLELQQPSHFFDPNPNPHLAKGKHRLT